MTGDLAGRTHGGGPTAQQVTEGDCWAVEIDNNPIAPHVILDLARALARKGLFTEFRWLGQLELHSALTSEYLATVTGDPDVQAVFRVPVHPTPAERLSSELYDSLTEPDVCRWGQGCGSYVGTDLLYCDRHREIADAVSERIARARA